MIKEHPTEVKLLETVTTVKKITHLHFIIRSGDEQQATIVRRKEEEVL